MVEVDEHGTCEGEWSLLKLYLNRITRAHAVHSNSLLCFRHLETKYTVRCDDANQ